MARIRTVKPEFWTSEQVAECSTITRLLFIGMWNFCDDGGNHPASLKSLKMQIFPSDDISVAEIGTMVSELIKYGLITQYTENNKDYWHVLGWHHQKIEKPNFKHPKYTGTTSRPFADHSPTDSQPFNPVMESKGMEGNGMDINKKEKNASEVFGSQNLEDEPDYLKTPPRQPHDEQPRIFKMYVGWTPEPVSWAMTLKASQHLTKNKPFTDYNLAEFIRRNVDGQEKTESNWQKYYVNAFAKGMLDEGQAPKTQQKDTTHSEPTPYVIKPHSTPVYERPSPEERARQVAELKRIREADSGL